MGSGGTATKVEAHVVLRPVPVSASAARRFVRETLDAWQCPELADTTTLLVSELVTNAVLHARSDVELVLAQRQDGLLVEVRDASAAQPVLKEYDDVSMTGRGMALVRSLAAAWGVRPAPPGKAVWFRLPLGT